MCLKVYVVGCYGVVKFIKCFRWFAIMCLKVYVVGVKGVINFIMWLQRFTIMCLKIHVVMVLTTNNWDLSGLAADELEWVAANCVAVRVDTPVFAPARTAPALPKPLPKARPSYKRQRAASG